MRNPKGTGSYRKRKDGRVEWRQGIDGKRRSLFARTPGELQDKVKKVADLPIIKSRYTADDWFVKWLDTYIQPLKKAATYNQYETIYRVHIKPAIGYRKLVGLKPHDIQSVITGMSRGGKSSSTMRHARKIMNIAFKRAVTEKILSVNPVSGIEIPNKQPKAKVVLNLEDVVRLFKALDRSRWIWSAKFMLITGMRRGELLALRWTDIDYVNKRITIDESNSSTGLGDTKTRVHYIPLSARAIDYLNRQKLMLYNENNPILYKSELKKTALIFPNQNGGMLRPGSYYTLIARAAVKAGIKASPHSLRHTFVYMNRKRLSLKELQSILGHDESTTTLDIYGDMIDESTDETAAQIDEAFAKLDEAMEKSEKQDAKLCKVIKFRKVK